MFARSIIYCSELVMTTVVKLWLQITGRLTIGKKLQKKLDRRKRYVYVSNHASYLDVFVMWAVLDFNQRINGAPTKVMTGPGVYFTFIRPFIWLLGAYPAKNVSTKKYMQVSRVHFTTYDQAITSVFFLKANERYLTKNERSTV